VPAALEPPLPEDTEPASFLAYGLMSWGSEQPASASTALTAAGSDLAEIRWVIFMVMFPRWRRSSRPDRWATERTRECDPV